MQSPGGNVLWDCVSLIDQATSDLLNGLGGVSAIAISHPHYYTTMVEWSRAFGGVPVYLHEADRKWVQRPDPVLEFWSGRSRVIGEGLTLIHCGGHFAGGTVLHWARGAGGRGALLTGDILQVTMDRRHVSFMRSYPNMWPLSRAAVESIARAVAPYQYDRIYGAWWDRHIHTDAQAAVARSLERSLCSARARRSRARRLSRVLMRFSFQLPIVGSRSFGSWRLSPDKIRRCLRHGTLPY